MVALRKEKLRQARIDAALAWLDGERLPESVRWLAAAREDALARLRVSGLPTRRDEYWKYSDPAALTAREALPAERVAVEDETTVFSGIDRIKLVFVDGLFDAEASDDPAMAGVEIERLPDAARQEFHWARDLYGKLEAEGQVPVERPLAALNTAFANDGVLIRVTGRAAKPVNISYFRSSTRSDVMLHHCVKIEKGAELTLLENGPAAARFSQVLEVDVAEGGRFHHVRAQGRDHERRTVTNLFARLGSGSQFKSFTLTANGALTRNEAMITMNGPDASAHIAGAAVGEGTFHHDDTIFVHHRAERCESRQVFKKVLRNGAIGVFQGKILVDRAAQLTDGYQISQSLLLGETSQFLAKPELEIYADDVKCSHGSTSGEIDADHMFYFRSRGIQEEEARRLLVQAFIAEAIEEIDDSGLAEEMRARLAAWLQRHQP